MIDNKNQQTTGAGYYVVLTAQTYVTLVSLLPSCSGLRASLLINLPSWDTTRRTTDDILSTVGAPGRGMRADPMANQMGFLHQQCVGQLDITRLRPSVVYDGIGRPTVMMHGVKRRPPLSIRLPDHVSCRPRLAPFDSGRPTPRPRR